MIGDVSLHTVQETSEMGLDYYSSVFLTSEHHPLRCVIHIKSSFRSFEEDAMYINDLYDHCKPRMFSQQQYFKCYFYLLQNMNSMKTKGGY